MDTLESFPCWYWVLGGYPSRTNGSSRWLGTSSLTELFDWPRRLRRPFWEASVGSPSAIFWAELSVPICLSATAKNLELATPRWSVSIDGFGTPGTGPSPSVTSFPAYDTSPPTSPARPNSRFPSLPSLPISAACSGRSHLLRRATTWARDGTNCPMPCTRPHGSFYS